MKIFLTGRPGCGKSSVLLKVVEILKDNKFKIGGIITPEKRVGYQRVGFYVKDIFSSKEDLFASIWTRTEHKIGKYFIDIASFERIALPALEFAMANCDVVCIDEIGKMEWLSNHFVDKVYEIVTSKKNVIAVLHRDFVSKFEKYGEILEVSKENRDKLPNLVSKKVISGSAQN